jgi:ABC-type uncharacterized transport system ATPase component
VVAISACFILPALEKKMEQHSAQKTLQILKKKNISCLELTVSYMRKRINWGKKLIIDNTPRE